MSEKGGYTAHSAKGKSNVFAEILKRADDHILVIADGAAFGPEMDRVMKLVGRKKGLVLYFPESFEWLILSSGVVKGKALEKILSKPEAFIESKQYFSWERFFTALLVSMTQDSWLKYAKRKLNKAYLQENISRKIVSRMVGIVLWEDEE